MSPIRRYFGQLWTLIATISEIDQDTGIHNRKQTWSTAIPPAFGKNWWTL